MARSFDGVTNYATVPLDLSASSTISIYFWFNYPTNYNNNNHTQIDFGLPNWAFGGFSIHAWGNLGTNGMFIALSNAAATVTYQRVFTLQSTNDWHDAFIVLTRATATAEFWLHGVSQAVTSSFIVAGALGNFVNSSLNFQGVAGANIGAGQLAEVAIWDGDQRGTPTTSPVNSYSNINSLTVGVPPPLAISTPPLIYLPWTGEAVEPELSGNRLNPTLIGGTATSGPPVRTMLQPGCVAG